MELTDERPLLRIGELSRRLGVSDHVLRAWESRYGLLRPVRTEGGFRLYSAADEHRVRRMQAYVGAGLSAAEAARTALAEDPPAGPAADLASGRTAALAAALRQALDSFDESAAQAALDRLLCDLTVPSALRDVVLPYLAELGDRWATGEASVAQEHFASNVLRGRLAGLARGWGAGGGPGAVLACPPGEQHDLALMCFGVVLNRHGWRVHYLGPDTPLDDVERAADATRPDLVVLAATMPEPFRAARRRLVPLARRAPLALAGAAVTRRTADALGARHLAGDPVSEAIAVTART